MSLKLKLSQMKKVSSDKTHTLMKTPEGHEVRIAHSALSKPHRKALESLPFSEGGQAPVIAMGEGKDQPRKMADGGQMSAACKNPDCKSHGQSHPNCKCYGGYAEGGSVSKDRGCKCCVPSMKRVKLADGGEPLKLNLDPNQQLNPQSTQASSADDQPFSMSQMSPALNPVAGLPDTAESPSNVIPQEAPEQSAPSEAPAAMEQAAQPKEASTPKSSAQGIAPQSAVPTQDPSVAGGYAQQAQGINQAAQAEAKIANAKAVDLGTNLIAQQKVANDYEAANKATNAELQAIRNDINNTHIDPNHYLGSQDTLGKIGTAIGLVLGGLGGGGRGNQVLDFVNAQIDRDINAQRANLGKKESIYNGVLAQSQNQRQATEMTRLIMNDLVLNKLQQAEMSNADPLIKARAQAAIGALQSQMAPMIRSENFFKLGMQQASQSPQQGASPTAQDEKLTAALRYMNPEMAKERESRTVPGVGMAAIPVSDATRDALTKQATLLDATHRMQDFIKQNGSIIDKLTPAKRAEAQSLALELQQRYRQGVGASTSDSEQHTINNIIGSQPLDILKNFTGNTSAQYKALTDAVSAAHDVTRKSVGLPAYVPAKEPQYKVVGGIKYMRGPNGEAVRVK